jgi:hypothetical protein
MTVVRGRPQDALIPSRSWAFVVASAFGTAFLLFTASIGMFVFGGDCIASEAECERVWEAQGNATRVYFGIHVAVIVVASLAVAKGRRRVPALLLVVTLATLALTQLYDPENSLVSWVPKQLSSMAPGLAILALASVVQLVEQTVRQRLSRENA